MGSFFEKGAKTFFKLQANTDNSGPLLLYEFMWFVTCYYVKRSFQTGKARTKTNPSNSNCVISGNLQWAKPITADGTYHLQNILDFIVSFSIEIE